MNATSNEALQRIDENDCSNSIALPDVMSTAISLAKQYSIDLTPGTPNTNDGGCAIEAVLDQINQRDCYPDKLFLSAQHYRSKWMSIAEIAARNSAFYPVENWIKGWSRLKDDGHCESKCFLDFYMMAILHCVRKNALIFNICDSNEQSPVSAIRADNFGGEADIEVPFVMVYDGSRYGSLIPVSDRDVQKTIYIIQQLNSFEESAHNEQLIQVGWSSECYPPDSRKQNISKPQPYIERMYSTGMISVKQNHFKNMAKTVEYPTSSIKIESKIIETDTDTEIQHNVAHSFCKCESLSVHFKCKKKYHQKGVSDSFVVDHESKTMTATTLSTEEAKKANRKRHRDLKRRKRAGETEHEKEVRREHDRNHKRRKKNMENVQETQARKIHDKLERQKRFATESEEKRDARKKRSREYQRRRIALETEEERNVRRKRNRDSKRAKYQSRYAAEVKVHEQQELVGYS